MAGRAGDSAPDPAAGAAGRGEATIVSPPPDNLPAEVLSLPPGVPPGDPQPKGAAPAR